MSADDVAEKPKDKKPDDQTAEKRDEEIETEAEQAPDASEIVQNLELSAAAEAPALEAASLSAIEQALSGQGGGGDFGSVLTFSSGGRIGFRRAYRNLGRIHVLQRKV